MIHRYSFKVVVAKADEIEVQMLSSVLCKILEDSDCECVLRQHPLCVENGLYQFRGLLKLHMMFLTGRLTYNSSPPGSTAIYACQLYAVLNYHCIYDRTYCVMVLSSPLLAVGLPTSARRALIRSSACGGHHHRARDTLRRQSTRIKRKVCEIMATRYRRYVYLHRRLKASPLGSR